jgi:hypothetical protein
MKLRPVDMSLILDHSKTVFLHLAKTGGTWVRFALQRAGVAWTDYGNQHANYDASMEWYPDSPRFTIVRNPFDWYASYWAMRQYEGWGGNWILGHDCISDDFNTFIGFVTLKHPGFLSVLYSTFDRAGVTVLRTEALAEGLRDVLRANGEQFDARRLGDTPITNPGASLPRFTDAVKYTHEAVRRLVVSEHEVFTRYAYPGTPVAEEAI